VKTIVNEVVFFKRRGTNNNNAPRKGHPLGGLNGKEESYKKSS
jgi:hypothetical protein